LKIGKSGHSVGSTFQPEVGTVGLAQLCALGMITTQGPRARWRGWCGFTGGLGIVRPGGTPRGSDSGCAGQGGVAGFSPETAGSGGAEKMARCGGGAPVAVEGVDVSYNWRR
jgi:hypothetical protein